MSFRDTIKAKIGAECYTRLENEAQKEVALAMQMALKDKFNEDQYYSPRLLLREFQADSERFSENRIADSSRRDCLGIVQVQIVACGGERKGVPTKEGPIRPV